MKRRVLSVLLCAGLVVSVLAGCGSDDAKKDSGKKAASESDLDYVKEKGTLVVGITNFEPMDYQDEEGEWIGFDADMAKAFGESLGVDVEFVDGPATRTCGLCKGRPDEKLSTQSRVHWRRCSNQAKEN